MAENLANLSTTALVLFDLKSFKSDCTFTGGDADLHCTMGVEVFVCFGEGVVELKSRTQKI